MPIIMDLSGPGMRGPALHTYDSVYPTYNFQPMITDRSIHLPLTGLGKGKLRVIRDPRTGAIRRVRDLRGPFLTNDYFDQGSVQYYLATPLMAVVGALVGAYLAGARLKR